MTILTHLASGYVLSKLYCANSGCVDNQIFAPVIIISSIAPDIDGLFGGYIKDHRNTFFHTPVFWLLIGLMVYIVGKLTQIDQIVLYTPAFYIGVFSHLFLDWFSGKTAGIRIFYPFSKKVYSLFPLNPAKGKVPVIPTIKNIKEYKEFIRFYLSRKFLLATEIFIIISAITLWYLS